MDAPDDRLAGDFVWELFPSHSAGPKSDPSSVIYWTGAAVAVIASWFASQPAAVLLACLAVAFPDVRRGVRLARTIPDKGGAAVCTLFALSWGAWLSGTAAIAGFFLLAVLNIVVLKQEKMFPGAFTALLLAPCGFAVSMVLTAIAMATALTSGMRVWLGEGKTPARILFIGLLIGVFFIVLVVPLLVWLTRPAPAVDDVRSRVGLILFGLWGLVVVGAIAVMILVDRACRVVLAAKPGAFDPKKPTIAKWTK